MDKFDFISDDKLKAMLIRDYEELQVCLKHHALKSVLILSGGIIEAVLLEYFTHNLPNNTTLEDIVGREETKDTNGNVVKFKSGWSLEKFINQAKNENLISEKIQQLSHLVRNYRNLIHPAKELRTLAEFDEETAQISLSLVNMVLKEVKANYAKKYPLTAENIFEKIKLDKSSYSILQQLLDKINQNEKDKLLELVTAYQVHTDFKINKDFPNLDNFFSIIRRNASEYKLLEQLEKFVKKVEIGESNEIMILFDLYGYSLDCLSEEKKEFVLSYVFGNIEKYLKIQNGPDDVDFNKFWILSNYLSNPQVDKKYFKIVMKIFPMFWNDSIDQNIVNSNGLVSGHNSLNFLNFNKIRILFGNLTSEHKLEIKNQFIERYYRIPALVKEFSERFK